MSSATEHTQADDLVTEGEVKDMATEGDNGVEGEVGQQDRPQPLRLHPKCLQDHAPEYPSFNLVIRHVKHPHMFDGSKGKLGPQAREFRHQDQRQQWTRGLLALFWLFHPPCDGDYINNTANTNTQWAYLGKALRTAGLKSLNAP
ncbi:hypothetical protein NLJ89_g6470 [Agrocybe chaxingu]|uniref:Uncharacterized protein n=1 Tax=Agrocybe chaxingu TaxID=84603 RepID=A0A9W8MU17_9AGAR|nr:hypothetical protein NLJ89_g6470 [Agrocybe chaxingu]